MLPERIVPLRIVPVLAASVVDDGLRRTIMTLCHVG
jgi:hypothetical protein